MEGYKINYQKNMVIINKEETEKKCQCIYCKGDVTSQGMYSSNLNNKKMFEFDEDIKIKLLYKRVKCKKCKRTFCEYSCSDIKKDLIARKKELHKAIFQEMFDKGVLFFEELEEREIEILKKENLNYKEYKAIKRIKNSMNQFDKFIIKAILINLSNFEIMELKYKETLKKEKEYTIKY